MTRLKEKRGFTLIELLLVIVIIGILLAVIVPRAWRANIDSKYGNVRQNCSEMAGAGTQWAENELDGQDDLNSSATLADYLAYLCGDQNGAAAGVNNASAKWVADNTSPGWILATTGMAGRDVGGQGTGQPPSGPAYRIMPVDKIAKNPFNGQEVFNLANFPQATPIPGAIAGGYALDPSLAGANYYYFAFTFQGTENTGIAFGDMHADSEALTLNGLRGGVFWARYLDF